MHVIGAEALVFIIKIRWDLFMIYFLFTPSEKTLSRKC